MKINYNRLNISVDWLWLNVFWMLVKIKCDIVYVIIKINEKLFYVILMKINYLLWYLVILINDMSR